jgi:vacuolar-type H+-ATPase subunit H
MREVIEGLLVAEREARGIVQAARAEADGLVADAKKRAGDLLAQVHEETRADASQTIEHAVEVARQEKARRLQQVTVEIQSQVRMDEVLRAQLVDAVVRCVCDKPG